MVTRNLPGDDRSGNDSDPRDSHHPLHDDRIGDTDRIFGVLGKGRKHHLGDPPEERQAQNRNEDHLFLPQETKIFFQILHTEIAGKIETLFAFDMGIWQTVCQQEFNDRSGHQRPSDRCNMPQDLFAAVILDPLQIVFEKDRIGQDTAQDRNRRHGLYDTVTHRDEVAAHQLFDIAIFGRRVDR